MKNWKEVKPNEYKYGNYTLLTRNSDKRIEIIQEIDSRKSILIFNGEVDSIEDKLKELNLES